MCACVCNAHRDQMKVWDILEMELLDLLAAIWVLGPDFGPLEEQKVLLTAELSLKPPAFLFETGSLISLEFTKQVILAGQWALGTYVPLPGLQMCATMPRNLIWVMAVELRF